jgi:hypothetical protein
VDETLGGGVGRMKGGARKLVYIIFKNSVRTAKETSHFTFTKIN